MPTSFFTPKFNNLGYDWLKIINQELIKVQFVHLCYLPKSENAHRDIYLNIYYTNYIYNILNLKITTLLQTLQYEFNYYMYKNITLIVNYCIADH